MELEGCQDIQGMDNTRDVTQDREQDVDEQVGAAATLQEDSQRGEEDGKNDLEDVAVEGKTWSALYLSCRQHWGLWARRMAFLPSGERHDYSLYVLTERGR